MGNKDEHLLDMPLNPPAQSKQPLFQGQLPP